MPDNAVNVELVDIDIIDPNSPLSWSSDRQTRSNLHGEITQWLRSHPYRVNDEPWVVVTREIYFRILGTILDPNLGTIQEVEYDTVRRQIDDDSRIVDKLKEECEKIFNDVWCEVANELSTHFTKPDPAHD